MGFQLQGHYTTWTLFDMAYRLQGLFITYAFKYNEFHQMASHDLYNDV